MIDHMFEHICVGGRTNSKRLRGVAGGENASVPHKMTRFQFLTYVAKILFFHILWQYILIPKHIVKGHRFIFQMAVQ